MITDLNKLAIRAKTSEQDFSTLMDELNPYIRLISRKYAVLWRMDLDVVTQWVWLEIWGAVKTYDSNGMPFLYYCHWTVANHVKTRHYRIVYGSHSRFNRQCVQLDFMDEQDDEVDRYWMAQLPKHQSTEVQAIRKELLQTLQECLENEPLTKLERECMQLFYFQNYSYSAIQQELHLSTRKPIDNALHRVKKKIAKNRHLAEVYAELQTV